MPLNIAKSDAQAIRNTSQQEALLEKAREKFISSFGHRGKHLIYSTFAPGRVNLIGEHTDYNNGFVMPVALEHGTVVYGTGKIVSSDSPEAYITKVTSDSKSGNPVEFLADSSLAPGSSTWVNYIKGVFAEYIEDIPLNQAFFAEIAISGSVPRGGGLSSSASLTVAIATFIETVMQENGIKISADPRDKARKCRRAEHKFLNTPCGIMDQFVCALAPPGCAILLDCKSETFEGYPLSDDSVSIVITDSKVTHSLSKRGNQYPVRVSQCETAAKALGVPSLREATLNMLKMLEKKQTDPLIMSRARHVISENERCVKFAAALNECDYRTAGQLMFESHYSLRDDYEVSIPELDTLVDLAKNCEGVYGARLTGAGFGGCVVCLVKTDAVTELAAHLKRGYLKKFDVECSVFATRAGKGSHVLVKPT